MSALPRRLAVAAFTILCVMLPALSGGASIDAPARDGEVARVARAFEGSEAEPPRSQLVQLFHSASASGPVVEDADLARARLASVAAIFVVTGLLYVLVVTTRGRTSALFSCLALAATGPVLLDGAVLRPELPAAVFGLLSVVLTVGFPAMLARRGGRRPQYAAAFASIVITGIAIGLSSSCIARGAVALLIPGGALILWAALLAYQTVRVLRRRRIERLPQRAMNARMLPWVLLCLGNMVLSLAVLSTCVAGEPFDLPLTRTSTRLIPDGWWVVPAWGLALAGGIRLLFAAGWRLSRVRKVEPVTILVVYVAIVLAQQLAGDPALDATLAAPALAVLWSEGVFAVVLAVAMVRARSR